MSQSQSANSIVHKTQISPIQNQNLTRPLNDNQNQFNDSHQQRLVNMIYLHNLQQQQIQQQRLRMTKSSTMGDLNYQMMNNSNDFLLNFGNAIFNPSFGSSQLNALQTLNQMHYIQPSSGAGSMVRSNTMFNFQNN